MIDWFHHVLLLEFHKRVTLRFTEQLPKLMTRTYTKRSYDSRVILVDFTLLIILYRHYFLCTLHRYWHVRIFYIT